MYFWSKGGHRVTFTSEEYINTQPDLSILRFALWVSDISRVIAPSGQTIVGYKMAEDSDPSV